MDMDKALKVLEDMKQKLMLMRDASEQFGEPKMARDYGKQVEALEVVLEAVK